MSEMDNAPVGDPQTTPPGANLFPWLHFHPWELRPLRLFMILYFAVTIIFCIAMIVPALGQWRLWSGVTFETSARTVFYSMVGMFFLRFFVPFYWDACRTPPPAWWQRAIPIGVLIMVIGLAGSGVIDLVHQRLGDVSGVPLYEMYVSGLILSGIGLVVFYAGNFGLMRAILRQQRTNREAASRRATQ